MVPSLTKDNNMTHETNEPLSGELVRDEKGRFPKGVSGNPAGRPKGTKNQITALRQNTELALRDYMASPDNARKAIKAIDRLITMASEGDMQAMKLLFDKVLPNARAGADEGEASKQKPVAIQIIQQTAEKATSPVTVLPIEEELADNEE
jgi:hypothetical protein